MEASSLYIIYLSSVLLIGDFRNSSAFVLQAYVHVQYTFLKLNVDRIRENEGKRKKNIWIYRYMGGQNLASQSAAELAIFAHTCCGTIEGSRYSQGNNSVINVN